MQNSKAIVTLAIGEPYYGHWKRFCENNWKTYAQKYGYDLVCLHRPLDESQRAQSRSPSWQKCLILTQDSLRQYHRIVWLDSDILINPHTAPDICDGIPENKIGGTEDINFSRSESIASARYLERAFKFWPGAIINRTAQEYYSRFGLPDDCPLCMNTGVLVMSPQHRDLLEYVYYSYDERGGREWHMEMRPLSYHIAKSGQAHWIDSRFNLMWPYLEIMYYPFLLHATRNANGKGRRFSILGDGVAGLFRERISRKSLSDCLNAAFHLSYFLHFGGMKTSEMRLVEQHRPAWWQAAA